MATLPSLVVPSQMPSKAAQRIYLAQILHDYSPGSPVVFSQRGGRKRFNRGRGRLVSKDLKALCVSGWLIAKQHKESEAYEYWPGPKLTRNSRLQGEWDALSQALFGASGLVERFNNSPVWGHGLFGFSQTLVLGTLVHQHRPLRRVDIINYLDGLVGPSSIDTALRTLIAAGVIRKVDRNYLRNPEWETNLQVLISCHPGGLQRKIRIAHQVQVDRLKYQNLVRAGQLTPRQRSQLLKKPCLRCGRRATQIEHFPPRKFGGKDHPHLVWATCKKCNAATKSFIRKLGPLPPITETCLRIWSGLDPNLYLRASLAVALRHFYRAADDKDYAKALRIVHRSCQLIQNIESSGLLRSRGQPGPKRRHGKRVIRGLRPSVQESSRLKY